MTLRTYSKNIKRQARVYTGDTLVMYGMYTKEQIDRLVNAFDYIPIATADELDAIRTAAADTFGAGTAWEGTYTAGLDKKYVLALSDDLEVEGVWVDIENFAGIFDGAGFNIFKDAGWFNPFGDLAAEGVVKNIPSLGFNPDGGWMLNPDDSKAFNFAYA